MTYLMHETVNGEASEEKIVTAEFVRRFSSPATRAFFEGLGGTEVYEIDAAGIIEIKSTSPDGETVREVVFTPLWGEEEES